MTDRYPPHDRIRDYEKNITHALDEAREELNLLVLCAEGGWNAAKRLGDSPTHAIEACGREFGIGGSQTDRVRCTRLADHPGICQHDSDPRLQTTAWDSNTPSTEENLPSGGELEQAKHDLNPYYRSDDTKILYMGVGESQTEPAQRDTVLDPLSAHTAGVDLSRPCVVCGAALSFHTKTDARRCLWTLVKPELQENDGEYDFSKGRAERLAPDAGADGRHIHNGQFWWRDGTCPVPGCPPEMNRPGHETAVLCECDDWDENPADPTSCKTCGHDVSYHEERGRDDSQEAPCWHPKAYPDVSAEREDERYFRLRDRIVDVMREQAAYDITPLELATHIAAALAGDVPAPGASPDPFSRPCPHSVRQAAIAIAKYTELKTPHNIDMQTLAHQVLKWASDVIEPASREDS